MGDATPLLRPELTGERVIKPPKLRKGATLAVIAPSSYPDFPHFYFYEGLEYVKSLGFKVVLGRTLTNASETGYFSADDKTRADDVNWAFKDESIDAIFCARGGVGSMRILSLLDYESIRTHPKLFVGASDSTPIQNAMFSLAGLVSVQGPMPATDFGKEADLPRTKRNWARLLRVLSGEELVLGDWRGGPAPLTIHSGRASGRLVGGTLYLVALLRGSRYFPGGQGKLLFLEDIAEDAWTIDNGMASLETSGYLREVKGVILGEFPRKPGETDPVRLEELLASYLSTKQYPSFMNYPFCHGFGREPLPIGIRAEVDADNRLLKMREPVAD